MQQPSHLFIFTFSWFPIQAEFPEVVTMGLGVVVTCQRFLDVLLHLRNDNKVEGLGLPPFDVADHFRGLLPFSEVHQTVWQIIRITILDKLQRRKEDTCERRQLERQGLNRMLHTNEGNTWGVNGSHERPILVKVFVAVDCHLTRAKLSHVSLTDLLPCPL